MTMHNETINSAHPQGHEEDGKRKHTSETRFISIVDKRPTQSWCQARNIKGRAAIALECSALYSCSDLPCQVKHSRSEETIKRPFSSLLNLKLPVFSHLERITAKFSRMKDLCSDGKQWQTRTQNNTGYWSHNLLVTLAINSNLCVYFFLDCNLQHSSLHPLMCACWQRHLITAFQRKRRVGSTCTKVTVQWAMSSWQLSGE